MKREATVALLTTATLLFTGRDERRRSQPFKAAAFVLSLAMAAGCIAAPEEIETAAASLDSPLLTELMAYESGRTSADDAIVLRTHAGPDGGLASFWWEVPDGVILEDGDSTYVEFLAAPVLLERERAPLERWIIMGFLADEGELSLNAIAFGAPYSMSASGLMGGAAEDVERSLEPFLFGAGGKIKPGTRIGFVVGGVAAEDVELALVLKPLRKEWDSDDDVPESTEDFLSYVGAAPMVALPPEGTGGLHQIALHYQSSGGFGGATVTSGPVQREGDSTDLLFAQRRAETISASFASGGYAIAAAGYAPFASGGSWAAVADAHGALSEARGTIVTPFMRGIGGMPYVLAIGEGDAPASTSLTLDGVSAGYGDMLFLLELDIDATLADLLGLPARKLEGASGSGIVERDGGDLRLSLGGARVVMPGIL